MTYQEAMAYLYSLTPFGIRPGLERMRELLTALGSPQHSFRAIHVAGTNGKGSTAAFVASILRRAGYRTGLYTSPHLCDLAERMVVDGRCIPRDRIAALTAEVRPRSDALPSPPTFFEVTTALAFLHFAREGVEWAVVEVGLGGRWDATNLVRPAVCIITNIALDHQEYLGSTLPAIAAEKAGIIKEETAVVTAAEEPALPVIRAVAQEKEAPLLHLQERYRWEVLSSDLTGSTFRLSGFPSPLRIDLLGEHQIVNAVTAICTVDLLRAEGIALPLQALVEGLREARWPGRLQIVSPSPLTLLDGAHNPAGAAVLARFLETHLAGRRIVMVFGVLRDKDWRGMLEILGPLVSRVILTRPENPRAADPHSLLGADRYCIKTDVHPSLPEALAAAAATAAAEDVILVTGSLFTVGAALAAYGLSPQDSLASL